MALVIDDFPSFWYCQDGRMDTDSHASGDFSSSSKSCVFIAYRKLSCNFMILSTNKGIKFQCYLVVDVHKVFWYLIHVKRQ
jgi:hypothetical protein